MLTTTMMLATMLVTTMAMILATLVRVKAVWFGTVVVWMHRLVGHQSGLSMNR